MVLLASHMGKQKLNLPKTRVCPREQGEESVWVALLYPEGRREWLSGLLFWLGLCVGGPSGALTALLFPKSNSCMEMDLSFLPLEG